MSNAHDDKQCTSVVIRSYPKIVFLWPTLLVALIAGIWTSALLAEGTLEGISTGPGRIFWWVFAMNLVAIAFDFTRGAFFALIMFFGLVFVSILLMEQRISVDFVYQVQLFLSKIRLVAHPHLYYMTAGALVVIFALVFVETRFDYWEVTHNELLHHHGVLGDVERFPAPNLRMTKEITDVFEYWLLLSGRLVLYPAGSQRAFVLDNVIGVSGIEARVQKMLATLSVKVEHSEGKS